MVAKGEDLEVNNLEENTQEEFDETTEDDDGDPVDDAGDEVEEESDEDDEEEDDEDEEDPEDHQDILKEKCGEFPKCIAFKEEFDICEARVNSRTKTEENCAQELLDFIGCVDHCVSKSLFPHLK